MDTLTNIALIECDAAKTPYSLDTISTFNGFHLKKVLAKRTITERMAKEQYPQSEIVQSKQAIINDKSIELVIVSSPAKEDLPLVGEVLESGKSVRIV